MNKVKRQSIGSVVESFEQLPSYAEEMCMSNKELIFDIEEENSVFKRCFMMFAYSRNIYKYARKIISVDGAFLHGETKGTLLSAQTVDGEGHIFPLAYAIVDVENENNWKYFLEKLKEGLDEEDVSRSMMVSDRHKGLMNGVEDVFGENFPRAYCVRHICANLKKRYKEKGLEGFIWEAAEAINEGDFMEAMEKIKNTEVRQELMNIKEHWTTVYFESFNAVLKDARGLPIVQSLEAIKNVVSTWIGIRQQESQELAAQGRKIVPTVRVKIVKIIDIAGRYGAHLRGNGIVEVDTGRTGYKRVFISEKKCDSGRWQQLGFPSSHAVAALMKAKLQPEDFCDFTFEVESYTRMYCQTFVPPRPREEWTEPDRPLSPPAVKRRAGRPAVKRKKAYLERL
ncbi:hypothetical protein RCL1_008959 [Eukaryota sp. TZLM3-RCL]